MEIKLEDLINTVNFIDLMVERGALKGEEIYSVGVLRNRLVEIVQFYNQKNESNEETSTEDLVNKE